MSDKLPCDVLVQPHTLIKAGCSVNTLMQCIEMRRKHHEKGPPLPNIISRTQADEIQSLRQRVERLEGALREANETIVAFAGPWATQYARDFDLPPGHLHPTHYDILEKAGGRMDDFTRAALSPKVQEGE